MFKVAIFSDIHGNLEALEAILSNIEKSDYDEVICLGDIIGIGPNPKECLELILKNKIKCVLGNHERYYLNGVHNEFKMSDGEKLHQMWVSTVLGDSYREILSKWGIDLNIVINDKKIGFMHYPFDQIENKFYNPKTLTEDDVKLMFRNYNYNFTFFGHHHNEQVITVNGNVFVDVGSSGCSDSDVTSYTVLDYDGNDFKILKKKCIYDRKKFEDKMQNYNYPEKDFIQKTFFKIEN